MPWAANQTRARCRNPTAVAGLLVRQGFGVGRAGSSRRRPSAGRRSRPGRRASWSWRRRALAWSEPRPWTRQPPPSGIRPTFFTSTWTMWPGPAGDDLARCPVGVRRHGSMNRRRFRPEPASRCRVTVRPADCHALRGPARRRSARPTTSAPPQRPRSGRSPSAGVAVGCRCGTEDRSSRPSSPYWRKRLTHFEARHARFPSQQRHVRSDATGTGDKTTRASTASRLRSLWRVFLRRTRWFSDFSSAAENAVPRAHRVASYNVMPATKCGGTARTLARGTTSILSALPSADDPLRAHRTLAERHPRHDPAVLRADDLRLTSSAAGRAAARRPSSAGSARCRPRWSGSAC